MHDVSAEGVCASVEDPARPGEDVCRGGAGDRTMDRVPERFFARIIGQVEASRRALEAGHQSTIFATGDGVYGFVKGLKATGVFNVGAAVEAFLARGGAVDL